MLLFFLLDVIFVIVLFAFYDFHRIFLEYLIVIKWTRQ